MSHPERRGGGRNLSGVELHSRQVASALGITYRKVENWTRHGIVTVESFRQHTTVPSTGSGSWRIYGYTETLQLGLAREVHKYQKDLDTVRALLSDPPEDFESWGHMLASLTQTKQGVDRYLVFSEEESLDLVIDLEESMGFFASSLSGVCVNPTLLKSETDVGIRRVLSTGE